MINKQNLILILSLAVLIFTACEKTEDDNIAQAQKCLDNAVLPADAANCSALIDGINNFKANRIRCSLAVLEGGTTQSEIINAFQAMDAGANSPVIELVTVLGLGDFVVNGSVDAAEEAIALNIKNLCDQTESPGLRTVGELILFGTRAQIQADLLGDPESPNDVALYINGMSNADAGEFGNSVFDIYCVPTYSNEDICAPLAFAGAGTSDDNTVGTNLKACLSTNTCN